MWNVETRTFFFYFWFSIEKKSKKNFSMTLQQRLLHINDANLFHFFFSERQKSPSQCFMLHLLLISFLTLSHRDSDSPYFINARCFKKTNFRKIAESHFIIFFTYFLFANAVLFLSDLFFSCTNYFFFFCVWY